VKRKTGAALAFAALRAARLRFFAWAIRQIDAQARRAGAAQSFRPKVNF
jgi:hypothetical protein